MHLLEFIFAGAAYASVDSFIGNFNTEIINPLIKFLFALAVVYFLFGLVQFIGSGGNDEKKTTGKSHMLWGIVGLTLMMGVWSILNIVLETFYIPKSQVDPEKGTVTFPKYDPNYPPKN